MEIYSDVSNFSSHIYVDKLNETFNHGVLHF